MRLRMRDRVEFLAELPDGFGALLDRKAVPEERVEVGHLFPTVAEDAAVPAGSGGPSLRGVHTRNIHHRWFALALSGFRPAASIQAPPERGQARRSVLLPPGIDVLDFADRSLRQDDRQRFGHRSRRSLSSTTPAGSTSPRSARAILASISPSCESSRSNDSSWPVASTTTSALRGAHSRARFDLHGPGLERR